MGGEGKVLPTCIAAPCLGAKVKAMFLAWTKGLSCKGMPPGRVQVMAKTRELTDALAYCWCLEVQQRLAPFLRRRHFALFCCSPQVDTAHATATSNKNLIT